MNLIGIFIGLVGLLLIFSVIWMMIVSVKQKSQEFEKKARVEARRKAVQRNHTQERQERISKAAEGHLASILFLAKEAELRDIKEAIYWYEKAAFLASPTGMYGVVRLCARFNNDAVMIEKSRFWQRYIKGIEGNLDALFESGKALIAGLGTIHNPELGIKTVEKAALSHHIGAQIYMGDWCLKDDVAKTEDANIWFAKAAKLESCEAMVKLGRNYLNGRGVEKDHKKGCFWLESAAERGDTRAMCHAGKAWIDVGEYGNSIAYIWLYMASVLNYEPAKALRDEVANKIGVDSLVVLQGFANPLLKKLRNGAIARHILIRALNRLYKRGVPIPTSRISDDGVNENGDEAFLSQLLAQERSPLASEQPPPED
jgi:TPR repeat protein